MKQSLYWQDTSFLLVRLEKLFSRATGAGTNIAPVFRVM
jgi:hypothetical protein